MRKPLPPIRLRRRLGGSYRHGYLELREIRSAVLGAKKYHPEPDCGCEPEVNKWFDRCVALLHEIERLHGVIDDLGHRRKRGAQARRALEVELEGFRNFGPSTHWIDARNSAALDRIASQQCLIDWTESCRENPLFDESNYCPTCIARNAIDPDELDAEHERRQSKGQ